MKYQITIIAVMLFSLTVAGCGGSPNRLTSSGERCQNLLRQADGLKGNPLQRSSVMHRYDNECSGKPYR